MLIKIKHALLKVIDVTALGFLEPYVRLAYREEPDVQVKKIVQFSLVPLLMVIAGLVVWALVISPNVKTKSGELPSPGVVAGAVSSLHAFAARENEKESAYLATGEKREAWLAKVEAELAAIGPDVTAANQGVLDARAAEASAKAKRIDPLQAEEDALKAQYKDERKAKELALKEEAKLLPVGDAEARQVYLEKVAALEVWRDTQKARIDAIGDQIKVIQNEKDPAVLAALNVQTAVAEREQYLKKVVEQLSDNNRAVKVAEGQAKVDEAKAAFASAQGTGAYLAAKKVISVEERLAKTTVSGYAKPATLYFQIKRSVLCVFAGFFLGSAIAIPIGILCGLSKTFMSALTPFIALFKPVSPIVWLPIALIVSSAFIPDPDKHWFTQWMWNLPWIGKYEINPAFMASAATVALCSLWATMVNTALGVASVDKDHLNVAKVLRLGFWSRLFKIVLPSSLPLVFAGLRISLGVGWMVLIAAELLSSSEGIGKFVWDQFNNGASDSFAKMMVVVFIVGAIGLLLDRIMVVFQRLVSFEGSIAAV